VVFTSSGTEAINAATWGAAERGGHVVCPDVEHSAVRDASARLDVTWVGVDRHGRADPEAVVGAIQRGRTALVQLQWGNHEVATLQPVEEVVAACRELDVLVHVDAAQAAGHVPIDFDALGADLLSGALLVRRGLRLRPLLVGGEQERARRAGMENVAAVAGFGAAALALHDGTLATEAGAARAHTERLLAAATSVDGVVAYGAPDTRLPHIVCVGVEGVEAEAVLIGLDRAGVAAHSGSACSSESLEPSPVLAAMGVDAERSLRLSVGWSTTDEDVEAFADAFPRVVHDLRALRTG
jgi:cysteine desulfurase